MEKTQLNRANQIEAQLNVLKDHLQRWESFDKIRETYFNGKEKNGNHVQLHVEDIPPEVFKIMKVLTVESFKNQINILESEFKNL